jgi:uncharacterized protein GlcG (DUF336 family)
MGLLLLSCGGGVGPPAGSFVASTASNVLTAAEVQTIVQTAAASVDAPITIAVTDRAGVILAVFRKTNSPLTTIGNFGATVNTAELAVALARTGSFFSNDQAPLSSRTVRYISGIHFPPGIMFTGPAALYGIENTNRGCPFNADYIPGKSLPPARSIDGTTTGLGIATGKADLFDSDPTAVNPGGVPIFKNGRVAGGVGVAGAAFDVAEYAAFTASVSVPGFGPRVPPPGEVLVDSIALPFVNNTARPAGASAGTFAGTFLVSPIASPGPVPEGDLVAPRAGKNGLTAADVRLIVDNSVATGNTTRAVIRLPIGSRARFVIAVADLDGTILALNRMPDATVFSVDVAVAKARNMVYFASKSVDPADMPGVPAGTAVTNRTISFGSQPFFPPGIDGTAPGPFFELYKFDVAHPCTNGHQPANPNQSGIVFFPGSVPLYKNGVLVGGLGISGDGVEQDDFATAGGAVGFEAPDAMRSDQIIIRAVRLPYLKFPRNPTN